MKTPALVILMTATGLALSACSITTNHPAEVQPAPVVMSPGTTTMVQPGSVIVPPRQ